MGLSSFGKVRSAAIQTLAGDTLPIAIDFGVSALKLLQLSAGEPTHLIAAASVETPEGLAADAAKRFAFQFQALGKVIRSGGFKGRRAVCAIPAAQTFCKHMQFPRSESVALTELVRTAVPAALNCSPDALVYRHVPVETATAVVTARTNGAGPGGGSGPEGGAKVEVICLAAARDFIQRLMDALRSAKLEVVGMHPECIATVRAFDYLNRREADKGMATLYLDLGQGTTKVTIAHGPELVFAKTIELGGYHLDDAIAKQVNCKLAWATSHRLAAQELFRNEAGAGASADSAGGPAQPAGVVSESGAAPETVSHGGAAARLAPGSCAPAVEQTGPDFDLREQLETLTDEIAMCLRYHEAMYNGRRVDRAVFFGGEARHRPLCQHIARRLRLASQAADPLARMARTGKESCRGVDFSVSQPGWTVPFGLSICPTDL